MHIISLKHFKAKNKTEVTKDSCNKTNLFSLLHLKHFHVYCFVKNYKVKFNKKRPFI